MAHALSAHTCVSCNSPIQENQQSLNHPIEQQRTGHHVHKLCAQRIHQEQGQYACPANGCDSVLQEKDIDLLKSWPDRTLDVLTNIQKAVRALTVIGIFSVAAKFLTKEGRNSFAQAIGNSAIANSNIPLKSRALTVLAALPKPAGKVGEAILVGSGVGAVSALVTLILIAGYQANRDKKAGEIPAEQVKLPKYQEKLEKGIYSALKTGIFAGSLIGAAYALGVKPFIATRIG
ncbi:MAG: hypothetical protein HKM07_03395 [Chlamydiae bacterium]|nr:hypothetical protein [Chlamydiota bacterium]